MPPVAILAGGLGTRLGPATKRLPKAMIEINGEPFVAHQIRLLKQGGFDKVVLCVGYLGEMIREFVGNGNSFGLEVEYSWDYPHLRGTAGAIRNALSLLGDWFFVLYGDSYLPCDYRSITRQFLAERPPGLMTVYRNQNRWSQSNVMFREGRVFAYDKLSPDLAMQYIDYGLSAFQPRVFFSLPTQENADLACIHQSLISAGELVGVEVRNRFFEVGSWEGVHDLESYLRERGSTIVPLR